MKALVYLFAAAAAALLAGTAAAQTIYRCGNEYTRVPCLEGKVVDGKNSAVTKQLEADAAIRRQQQLGDRMEQDRLRAEKAQRPALAGNVGPRPPAPTASASLKPKKKARAKIRIVEGDDFTARAPKAKK